MILYVPDAVSNVRLIQCVRIPVNLVLWCVCVRACVKERERRASHDVLYFNGSLGKKNRHLYEGWYKFIIGIHLRFLSTISVILCISLHYYFLLIVKKSCMN